MPAIPKIDLTAKPQNKKIIFSDDEEPSVGAESSSKQSLKNSNKSDKQNKANGVQLKRKPNQSNDSHTNGVSSIIKAKPKKIKFNDDGEIESVSTAAEEKPKYNDNEEELEQEEDFFAKKDRQRLEYQTKNQTDEDAAKKWYHVYPQYPSTEDVLDMKDSEQMECYSLCKTAFESEKSSFNKRNPSDYRWLQTALTKGTARDRANAGALLVASNPLGNLEALSTLIGFTKLSNKSSTDVINIITDLWKEVLLPPHRKLLSLQMRGADWKLVRLDNTLTKQQQSRIYAYWFYENELKDQYFEFLKNLQQAIQTGQENNKNIAIVAAAQLLAFGPEKEQLLLTMLVNKLGDPMPKVASKALHHLTEVAHHHPNMCSIIVTETEKLLFRNNISDRAQHFALCFLSSIAPAGRAEVCTKLVNICFALFKVLVQKGAVNSRIMQAILRCLQKAIVDAEPAKGSTEILSKEMQDTVYRLVHLADIRISVQTLGLLLQLITIKTEKNDRFYNALYIKMLDMELTSMGTKTAAQLLHIVHRAMHVDKNLLRVLAFIKRLLQLALYCPPHITAGCLIVLSKLLKSRKELNNIVANGDVGHVGEGTDDDNKANTLPKVSPSDAELAKFDSDGEEKYEDIRDEQPTDETPTETKEETKPEPIAGSWHHAKVKDDENIKASKVKEISACKYDPYHRVPAFAGAEFAVRDELLFLKDHFHPTVQVFAESLLSQKRIAYYGDPLRDFGLPHFLERFAFKNPKKMDSQNLEAEVKPHKRYTPYGPRGKSVRLLTKDNCTEDEMFILNFLEQKRQRASSDKDKKKKKTDDGLEALMGEEGADDVVEDVDDEEFEDYLDGFFGKKSSKKGHDDNEDEELDFLKELGGELASDKKKDKKSKKSKAMDQADDDDDMEDIDADWDADDDDGDGDDDEEAHFENDQSDLSDDEAGSIDLNNDEDDLTDASISMDEDAPSDLDDEDDDDDDDDDDEEGTDESDLDDEAPKSKSKKASKSKPLALDGKSFAKKLKHSTDMSSLFAAADDFAELLEETGKTKGQGTANAIFNKDKSSDKQLKWEAKRHSTAKQYTSKKKSGPFKGGKQSFSSAGGHKGSGHKFKPKQKKR